MFRYWGMAVTNQNYVHDEIKKKLNMKNACYHPVQNILESYLIMYNS